MAHRLLGILAGIGLLSVLHGGGAGGCGSAATGTGGGGATTTTGATAASQGALTSVTGGMTSALNASIGVGGLGGLRLKSTEDGDEDLSCSEDGEGDFDCGDRDEEDGEGHLGCDFEGEETEASCGPEGSLFSFDTDFTMIFEDFSAGDECGQEVVLSGTVGGHVEGSFNQCTGASSFTISLVSSAMTVTLEDGASHTVTFDLTFNQTDDSETVSGEICVDGACSDIDSSEDLETTECDELEDEPGSCEFVECSMDANEDGVEDDPDHFACQMAADDDPDDAFETDNVTCDDGCCVLSD